MENSLRAAGFMAVFAVSGSVVLLSMSVHKHLMSDFMKKIEAQMGTLGEKDFQEKKKVSFSDDVVELTSSPENGDHHHLKKHLQPAAVGGGWDRAAIVGGESLESMPPNWQVLYKGIIKDNKAIRR